MLSVNAGPEPSTLSIVLRFLLVCDWTMLPPVGQAGGAGREGALCAVYLREPGGPPRVASRRPAASGPPVPPLSRLRASPPYVHLFPPPYPFSSLYIDTALMSV